MDECIRSKNPFGIGSLFGTGYPGAFIRRIPSGQDLHGLELSTVFISRLTDRVLQEVSVGSLFGKRLATASVRVGLCYWYILMLFTIRFAVMGKFKPGLPIPVCVLMFSGNGIYWVSGLVRVFEESLRERSTFLVVGVN